MKYFLFIFAFLSISSVAFGQDDDLVQVTGIVMTSDSLRGIPYATVAIKGTSRGSFANFDGFFSLVARKGDVLQFVSLGFKDIEYTIPEDTKGNRLTIVQLMTADVLNLPETIVFPWPSREHFRLEFLAMDVSNAFEETAQANLAQERLNDISEVMVMDGNENSDFFLRQQAKNYYHYGQAPPQHIFNAFAWAEFIKAWQRGDFKKKKD